MKLNPITLALSLALTALAADAQNIELGSDASGYKRFLLYPHLQKGFEAIELGNRNRALNEFEQARTIAPNNAIVATWPRRIVTSVSLTVRKLYSKSN
jgi:bacteriophage N4 adsorption protein A